MGKPHREYHVTLTGEERGFLEKLIQKGNTAGYRIRHGLLIVAPGNYIRMGYNNELGDVYYNNISIIMLFRRFFDITIKFNENYGFTLLAIAALLGFDLLYHQKHRLNFFSYFYALAAFASTYSMALSPDFPDRAFLIVIVFSGITLMNILTQLNISIPVMAKRNRYLIVILLLLALSFSFLKACKNMAGIYLKWQNRIEYILTEKEKGILDVEVKAPIPATDRHTALYGLSDIIDDKNSWPNISIAEYFGLNSIKRRYGDGQRETVW